MKNIEQELKLQLTEREYRILLEASGGEPQLQTNYYFGCGGMPRDSMVRVRQKGDSYTLCYKRRMSDVAQVVVCDERECPLTEEHARYIIERGVTKDEMRRLLDVRMDFALKLYGKLDTYRVKFVIDRWTLELDRNVYLGRQDYELECENGDVNELEGLKNYLTYTYGVVVRQSRPKSERFFDALNE